MLFNLSSRMLLLGASAASAHAFGQMNPLLQRVPVPGQVIGGAQRPAGLERLSFDGCNGMAILGGKLLFVDEQRNRVLCLQDGALSLFAGKGGTGQAIDPTSALQTEVARPQSLLVLKDQSVLVVCRVDPHGSEVRTVVLRIRTQVQQGEATVSVFAGSGQGGGDIVPASARDTPLGHVPSLAQERDGSVLLVDASRSQILRVRPSGTIEVAVKRVPEGVTRDPESHHLNVVNRPSSIAVAADDSILVCCKGHPGYVLRIQNNVTTLYAGEQPGAEYPIPIGFPDAIGTDADGTVWIVDRPVGADPHIYRIAPDRGIALIAGPAPDRAYPGVDFHRNYVSSLSNEQMGAIRSLTPLPDGSLLLGSTAWGMHILSPGDAYQRHLKELANQGKAAVLAGKVEAFSEVERALAYLCAPSNRSFAAVNHAAHDLGRLEPVQPAKPDQGRPEALPLKPVMRDLMPVLHGFAAGNLGEQLRAQLVLMELRQYRRDHLEPYLRGLVEQGKAAVHAGNAEAYQRVEQAIADAGVSIERFYAAVAPAANPQGLPEGVPLIAVFSVLMRGPHEADRVAENALIRRNNQLLARAHVHLAQLLLHSHRQEHRVGQ
jgi:hypothetical protein